MNSKIITIIALFVVLLLVNSCDLYDESMQGLPEEETYELPDPSTPQPQEDILEPLDPSIPVGDNNDPIILPDDPTPPVDDYISQISGLWIADQTTEAILTVFQFNDDLTIYEYFIDSFTTATILITKYEGRYYENTMSMDFILDNYFKGLEEHDEYYMNDRLNRYDQHVIQSGLHGDASYVLEGDLITLSNGIVLHRFIDNLPPYLYLVSESSGDNQSAYLPSGYISYSRKDNILTGYNSSVLPNVEVEACIRTTEGLFYAIGKTISESDGSFQMQLPPLTISEILITEGVLYIAATEHGKTRSPWKQINIIIFFANSES